MSKKDLLDEHKHLNGKVVNIDTSYFQLTDYANFTPWQANTRWVMNATVELA
jgi:hypothetical protein